MLTITRRQGETVVVTCGGHRLEVTVLGFQGAQARLGFDAGPEFRIQREELVNRQAVQPSIPDCQNCGQPAEAHRDHLGRCPPAPVRRGG
jgi:carbon storage regulator CsrA